MVEIFGAIIRETDMGILFSDGDREVWLPKSQIIYDEDAGEGDDVTVEMPQWLAFDKELI